MTESRPQESCVDSPSIPKLKSTSAHNWLRTCAATVLLGILVLGSWYFFFDRQSLPVRAKGQPTWIRLTVGAMIHSASGPGEQHLFTMGTWGPFRLLVCTNWGITARVPRMTIRDRELARTVLEPGSEPLNLVFQPTSGDDHGAWFYLSSRHSAPDSLVRGVLTPFGELPTDVSSPTATAGLPLPGEDPIVSDEMPWIAWVGHDVSLTIRFVDREIPVDVVSQHPLTLPYEFMSPDPTPLAALPGQRIATAGSRSIVVSYGERGGLAAGSGTVTMKVNVPRAFLATARGNLITSDLYTGPLDADLDSLVNRITMRPRPAYDGYRSDLFAPVSADSSVPFSFAVSPDTLGPGARWLRAVGPVEEVLLVGQALELRLGSTRYDLGELDELFVRGQMNLTIDWISPGAALVWLEGQSIHSCQLNGQELLETRWESLSSEERSNIIAVLLTTLVALLGIGRVSKN